MRMLQQWLHERASMLRYTYTACLVEGFIQWTDDGPTETDTCITATVTTQLRDSKKL